MAVTRVFADEGNFTGTIVAVRKMGCTHVYTVQYPDGDVEELDESEYVCAYTLWLRESGGMPEVHDVKPAAGRTSLKKPTKLSKAARARIAAVIDLTGASTIAGQHMGSMTESALILRFRFETSATAVKILCLGKLVLPEMPLNIKRESHI